MLVPKTRRRTFPNVRTTSLAKLQERVVDMFSGRFISPQPMTLSC